MNSISIILSIILLTILFFSIVSYTYTESNNEKNNFRKSINLEDDIIDMPLSKEISLSNHDIIFNCIDIYYQNNKKNVSFEEYRDYWKPYSLEWVCKKIKNKKDL
jgi:hypothetical protein